MLHICVHIDRGGVTLYSDVERFRTNTYNYVILNVCTLSFGGHASNMTCYFYHGCNILTNQIAQKQVDKSLIIPTSYLSTCKRGARVQSN